MGGITRAVGHLVGSIFGFGRQSAPTPVTVKAPAPAVQAPEADIAQKTTEGDLSVNRKKRRGKASLIIDKNPTSTSSDGSGLNI